MGGATAAALCGTELMTRVHEALRPLLRLARGGIAASAEEEQAPQAGRTPRGAAAAGGDDHTPSTDPDVRARRSRLAARASQHRCLRAPCVCACTDVASAAAVQCLLVRKGYALNPSTDRMIKIGGPVYNKLVATEGYVLNRSTGEMQQRSAASAPPGARRGAEATTPASAVAPRRLERALAEESPADPPPAGSAGRSQAALRFASSPSPSPPGRKPRAAASPKPAARRKSGRT